MHAVARHACSDDAAANAALRQLAKWQCVRQVNSAKHAASNIKAQLYLLSGHIDEAMAAGSKPLCATVVTF